MAQHSDDPDTGDSDVPISSMRRLRQTKLRSVLRNGHHLTQANNYSSADSTDAVDRKDEAEGEDNDNDEDNNGDEDDGNNSDNEDGEDDEEEEDLWTAFSKELRKFETDENIRRRYPPSLHPEWLPSMPPSDEHELLEQMILTDAERPTATAHDQPADLSDYQEFVLRDFVVYLSVEEKHLPPKMKNLKGEMLSLEVVATQYEKIDCYLDGYLEEEGTGALKYCHRMLVRGVNIGCLQDPHRHSTKDQIYIRSENGYQVGKELHQDIWYRLEEPTAEYAGCFAKFVWVADFMKHFLDYLSFKTDGGEKVYLEDFKQKFFEQLHIWHSEDPEFQGWHRKCESKTAFGQHMARHADFLYDQIFSLETILRAPLLGQPIWREICPTNRLFSSREGRFKKNDEQTVVTENVKRAFCPILPAWGEDGFNLLKVVSPVSQVENTRRQRMRELRFPDKYLAAGPDRYHNEDNIPLTGEILEKASRAKPALCADAQDIVGKVVIVRWMEKKQPRYSYALVRRTVSDKQSLAVVWLLKPQETILGKSPYAHGNELFFSDKCNCQPVSLSDVMAVYGITLFSDRADANADATFFVGIKYFMEEDCFRTANPSDLDLDCSCPVSITPESEAVNAPDRYSPLADQAVPHLRTLSLFSGCGLLDRGLEDSNVIKVVCAVDCNEYAVQTSLVNQREKFMHRTCSVNYLLERILQGAEELADYDCVVSGCPCPGFSIMNMKKAGKNAQRNCSLLASTLSYVETFLPHYFLLENVPGMDIGNPSACQLAISFLVGLGYQVRKTKLKACEFGAPQIRERLFIFAASSGLPLPRDPLELKTSKPFPTVSEAIGGLPEVDNDTTINIANPDHIPLKQLKLKFEKSEQLKPKFKKLINLRTLLQKIPTSPSGMSLYQAWDLGLLDPTEEQWYHKLHAMKRRPGSKVMQRLDPNKPFPTILTRVDEMDAFTGICLHPSQDRLVSLEEYKIAQGFPKDYIIIGPLNKQAEQVGNAVPYPVAKPLGVVMSESFVTAHRQGLIPYRSRAVGQNGEQREEDQDVDNGDFGGFQGTSLSAYRSEQRRKRIRAILDSDDEAKSGEETATTSLAARHRTNNRWANDSARATEGGITESGNTAEDPILLPD